jgi:ubiquinone/menaquinone biosynthesis C-methylase UbiE
MSVSYREFTGTAAENYQRYFVPAIATPVSVELLATADPRLGERVLDVACGTGVIARLVAERVGAAGSVTGIDIAPEMIEVAHSVPAPLGGPHIDWQVADAASLPLPDDSVDLVVCQMGLMFIEDKAAALAEMRRVLTPGGRLAISTPGAIQPVFAILEKGIEDNISPDLGVFVRVVFSLHDPDAVAGMVRDAGLNDVSVTVSPAVLQLAATAEFLWQYINLTPIGPAVAQAPESARAALERQVVEGCQPYVIDGRTTVEQPMVIATAQK